jgi:hypothetical protein
MQWVLAAAWGHFADFCHFANVAMADFAIATRPDNFATNTGRQHRQPIACAHPGLAPCLS